MPQETLLVIQIFNKQSPKCLFEIISTLNMTYITRNLNRIPLLKIMHNFFKNSFFPSAALEWNKLDLTIRKLENVASLKKSFIFDSSLWQ